MRQIHRNRRVRGYQAWGKGEGESSYSVIIEFLFGWMKMFWKQRVAMVA